MEKQVLIADGRTKQAAAVQVGYVTLGAYRLMLIRDSALFGRKSRDSDPSLTDEIKDRISSKLLLSPVVKLRHPLTGNSH